LDLAIALLVMFGLLAVYGIGFSWQLLALPALAALVVLTAFGIGSALAALCAVYRDVRYVVPFLLQLWMFASPVIYSSSLVPSERRWLFLLNPMTGAIDGFRAALLGRPFDWLALGVATVVAGAGAWAGVRYFRRVERRVADLI
jgi:lipopolysaccharide transport system permease protein